MKSSARIILIVVASIFAVLAIGAGTLFVGFDPNSLKPRIVEAVKRATGRDLALNGKIGLKVSLWPTVEVQDVSFANPPGFSRRQMATLQAVELQLGLMPLLSSRVEIKHLTLIHPNILLETNAAGNSNWTMTPEVSPTAPSGDLSSETSTSDHPPAADVSKHPVAVSVQSIQLLDGTLGLRDDRTGRIRSLAVERLTAKAASPDAQVLVQADATYSGLVFSLAGDTGSLTRLQDQAASTPWPVNLALTAAGSRLGLSGTLRDPLDGKGYTLSMNGSIPDLSIFAPLLPAPPLPLRDIRFTATITDSPGSPGGGLPAGPAQDDRLPTVSALTLHVGAADLEAQVHGLRLDSLDVSAAKLDEGFKADAAGRFSNLPFSVSTTFGPATALTSGATTNPVPFTMTLQVAGIPVTAKASLIAATGGFRNGAALHGLSLSSRDADVSGDAELVLRPRPLLTAILASNRIDLDAWRASIDHVAGQPAPQPDAPSGAMPPGVMPPGAIPPQRPSDDRIFSDRPLPFARLRAADADLNLTIGALHSTEVDAKAIRTHVVLNNGKLTVDPLAADLPQGHIDAKLLTDAGQPSPPVHLMLHAADVAVKLLLTVLHQPPLATGNLEVQADLSGAGLTPHAVAASLDGTLGLAVAGGTIDNRVLGSILGRAMNDLNALDLVGRGGASDLRCFGARLDARHGVATIRALALSSSLLTMTGLGTLNLADETMALTLRPEVRIAGASLVVPIGVSGPIQKPATSVNKISTAASNVGSIAGAVVGDATPLGIVGGLLGVDRVLSSGDVCPAALAAGRGQTVPPAAAAAPKTAPSLSNPSAELRRLFK